MLEIQSMVVGLFTLLLSGVLSWFWWEKKEDKKTLIAHSKDITRIEAKMVDEDKVREIVTEVVSTSIIPLHEIMMDIKGLVTANSQEVNQLKVNQAVERGYREALSDIKMRDLNIGVH